MAFNPVEAATASFVGKIRPDPLTGRLDLNAVSQYMMNNASEPGIQSALRLAREQINIRNAQKSNLRTIDLRSLPLQENTIWLIKLQFGGLKDANGKFVFPEDASSHRGVRQCFHLHSWIHTGPHMEKEVYRMVEEFVGIPTSKQVEDFIRGSMAMPFPIFEPCLPNGLVLSSNLSHHEDALCPFLDSLPSPFWWNFRAPEIEGLISEINYKGTKSDFRRYITLAKSKKDEGNKAYSVKNAQAAVICYEEAIDSLSKAIGRLSDGDDEMYKEASGLQAICFANSSISRLLIADEENIKKAIEDAKSAIGLDGRYPKGYIRLSRAYEALGKLADAEAAIAKALRLPELENNKGLVDHLILLQTDGKGLPTDVDGFEKWYKETFSEGEDRAKRMQGVGGLWFKICNDHVNKMRSPGPKN